ncbi:hypothetical protein AVEN_69812-1 [Araneus ventricosus]|uniref:Tetraspanin n=1 Tax=Araneus ventricosus TaxID=182803 RepID=A0A4Y2N3R8_ARAVE|nr:hypothetical protein AVEN_69812-1 [Araneus ventricosus]
MKVSYKKTFETRVEEHRRYTTFTGAEVWHLLRNLRRYVRVLASFCAAAWGLGLTSFIIAEWIDTDLTHEMEHTEDIELEHRPRHEHLVVVSCVGAFTFMTGILGYWGTLHLEHRMVCIFSYIILFNSIIGLSFGAMILTIPLETLEENTIELVKTQVDESLPIFLVQKFLHCCGASSPSDWIESPWWHNQRAEGSRNVLPISCCIAPHKNWTCNQGKSPFREVFAPNRVHLKGCADIVLERKKYLIRAGGHVISSCGLGQLISFFAIHYLASIVLYYQHRLDEIREQVPEAAHIRKPPHDPRAEARFEKRLSMKV